MRMSITMLLSLMFLSGCLAHNGRCWVKGDIKFEGDKRFGGKQIFTEMHVGNPCKPLKSLPEIGIEFQNGTVIALCDIDMHYLEKNAMPVTRIYLDRQNRDIYGCTWPDDVKVFEIGNKIHSILFAVNQEQLVGLWSQSCTDILWDRKKTKRLSFPLSEEDLGVLFGRPDRVYDYFRGGL